MMSAILRVVGIAERKYYKHTWSYPYSVMTQYSTSTKMPECGAFFYPREFWEHEGLWPKYKYEEVTKEEYNNDGPL